MSPTIEKSALLLFKHYGLKNVSIKDIALRANVPENLITDKYNIKENLVNIVFIKYYRTIRKEILQLKKEKSNPLINVIWIYDYLVKEINSARPVFFQSIKQYYPHILKVYYNFQDKILQEIFHPLYKQAKDQRIIREDADIDSVLSLHKMHFNQLVEGNKEKDLPGDHPTIFRNIVINNLRSILINENYAQEF